VHLEADVWLDRFEVTNARYQAFLAAPENAEVPAPDCTDGADLWSAADRALEDGEVWRLNAPVACVTAAQAAAYCAWEGKRLPTEAEWEAGARGADDNPWPWGAEFVAGNAQCFRNWAAGALIDGECSDAGYPANLCEGNNPNTQCEGTAVPAVLPGSDTCSRPGESDAGLCHVAGNVAEWTADGWSDDHQAWGCATGCTAAQAFVAPEAGGQRVVRGGSWDHSAHEIVVWAREARAEGARSSRVGFRCAWSGGL